MWFLHTVARAKTIHEKNIGDEVSRCPCWKQARAHITVNHVAVHRAVYYEYMWLTLGLIFATEFAQRMASKRKKHTVFIRLMHRACRKNSCPPQVKMVHDVSLWLYLGMRELSRA